ncbi:hypothetical protein JCM16775_1187 [Leptotrichia hofstadii]|uniref:HNH nuclease domain-containing protein n=1 Tax=Leptotrichia hofstadii TaxID=157688 RepID=A0A510JGR7_9FUSO|nr:hypothetical protein [Leptotrichia hofstadii]BBM38478.1 hypothetical protein JCM16775_1187 [Leptotrichia hofstadii]
MIKIDIDERKWKKIKEEHSEWYCKKIFPKVKKAFEELKKLYEDKFSDYQELERYVEMLKKIVAEEKGFVIKEELFLYYKINEIEKLRNLMQKVGKKKSVLEVCFEKLNISEEYLPNQLFCYEKLQNGNKDWDRHKLLFLMGIEVCPSEWYYKKIFPKIKKAFEELKKLYEDKFSDYEELERYVKMLKKIVAEEKEFVIKEELFLDYKINEIEKLRNLMQKVGKKKSVLEVCFDKLKIPKKYLPNQLFCYKKLYKEGKWSRHKLLSLMGIEVCPYCQRNYISNYADAENNDEKTTATLDHFYPKADYPFLALSLYNFVPSCQVCNSIFKGDADTRDSIYPHEEGFDELGVKFKTSKEAIYEILGEKDSDFSVKIDYENLEDEENKKKVENSIGNLGLDRVYKKSHNQYIQDLLYTIEKYPENYLEACGEMFENNNDKKKQLEEYFKDIVKEPYRKRIENGEPLAKLTKDILEEFDIKI